MMNKDDSSDDDWDLLDYEEAEEDDAKTDHVNETTSNDVNETTSNDVNETTSDDVNDTTSDDVNETTSGVNETAIDDANETAIDDINEAIDDVNEPTNDDVDDVNETTIDEVNGSDQITKGNDSPAEDSMTVVSQQERESFKSAMESYGGLEESREEIESKSETPSKKDDVSLAMDDSLEVLPSRDVERFEDEIVDNSDIKQKAKEVSSLEDAQGDYILPMEDAKTQPQATQESAEEEEDEDEVNETSLLLPQAKNDDNKDISAPGSSNSSDKDNADPELEQDVKTLHEMGFSVEQSKVALVACDGNLQEAINSLLGVDEEQEEIDWVDRISSEIKHTAVKVNDKYKIVDRARSVGQFVEGEADRVCGDVARAYEEHNVGGRARNAMHHAKLKARGLGRDAKAFNEKYNVTGTLATVGVVVAAAALAGGNMRTATTAAAVAGTTYVAGEGLRTSAERSRRNDDMYE